MGPPRPHPPRAGLRRLGSLLRRSKNRRRRPIARATVRRPPADPAARRRLVRLGLALLGVLVSSGAVCAGVLLAHRVLTRSPHFAIRQLRLPPMRHVSAEALGLRAGVVPGQNLFAVEPQEVERRLRREPWLASVRVHRELPSVLAVDATEREAACAVALGPIYLVDAQGVVFKRATPEEAAAWPVITGIPRAGYLNDRDTSQASIREGLQTLAAWRGGGRPPLGEVHVDPAAGITLYTRHGGLAVRLGRGDPQAIAARLARVDAVLAALAGSGERPRVIYADSTSHPERVTVHLAPPAGGS